LINKIQKCFETDSLFYTQHSRFEIKNEEFGEIFDQEVYEAICNGEIIKEYPQDKPYPSVLIFGRTATNRPLHIVSAYDDEENLTIVITVYQPNPKLWMEYKRRMKQ